MKGLQGLIMVQASHDERLFEMLFFAQTEIQLDAIILDIQTRQGTDWTPLGANDSNFGVIENQQSNPVAALVEKLTNSVDAILMRRCLELGIDPKSADAPRSVDEAIDRFFPDHKNWDLTTHRNQQAQSIQVIADSHPGDTSDTSLIIYDDGEGQHPEDFEATFLSLLRGNKNEIHFVQGKYNMGGSGAIVFCGKRRYQLIGSKRHDGSGLFGFTLVRKHPLTQEEAQTKKSTWYEYLKIDGKIPAFPITELDLGLLGRKFTTGTIIKLYSYELKGNRNIRRDLRRSLNEFLYAPALPIYMVESAKRYPNDNALKDVVFGLKRRLQDAADTYVEATFSETYSDKRIGQAKVTVHVFRTRVKDRNVAETRVTIRDEFFKNGMAVLFSINGQVHGHYTSEFITRSLKYNLLRDYLLIHVDCTEMNYDFRSELFMASRDRLKQGEESGYLRDVLARNLMEGQLHTIYKKRKDIIASDVGDDDDLLKTFAENLPISTELRSLLSKTFKLEREDKPKRQTLKHGTNGQEAKEKIPFKPQRFPSFFKLDMESHGDTPVVRVPLNGEKTVRFATDVEDQYFDRTDEPGDLQVAVMKYTTNDAKGGNAAGTANEISDVFNVTRRSPNEGTIKIVFKPTDSVKVGDQVQVQVDLTSPGQDFSQVLWVKIAEPQAEQPKPIQRVEEEEKLGLPQLVKVYASAPDGDNRMTWETLANAAGASMDYDTVMHPLIEGDVLQTIYINMDSNVIKSHRAKLRSVEQHQVADRRYLSAIYFHTLFLYAINKQRGYQISKSDQNSNLTDIELTDYLRDLFSSNYAAFLLNFGMSELIDALG